MDAEQLDLGGQSAGDIGTEVALAIHPIALAVGVERLHPHHSRNGRQSLGEPGAAGLDIDDMAAAEDPPGQFGDACPTARCGRG